MSATPTAGFLINSRLGDWWKMLHKLDRLPCGLDHLLHDQKIIFFGVWKLCVSQLNSIAFVFIASSRVHTEPKAIKMREALSSIPFMSAIRTSSRDKEKISNELFSNQSGRANSRNFLHPQNQIACYPHSLRTIRCFIFASQILWTSITNGVWTDGN